MKHDVFHVFDTTLRDGAQREDINPTVADKPNTARHLDESPFPNAETCTFIVTLRESRGALGRIAATLSNIPVLALSYAVAGGERATAEIQVPQTHVARARGKLNRMVDALAVTERERSDGLATAG